MNIQKTLLALTLTLATLPAMAGDDFGIWTEVGAQKQITKRLTIGAGIEMRLEDQLKNVADWRGSVDLGYKLNKYLRANAGYVYIYDHSLEKVKEKYDEDGDFKGYNVSHPFWRSKHRGYFSLTGKLTTGRFTFSLRERYQYTYRTSASYTKDRYRKEKSSGTYEYLGHTFKKMTTATEEKGSKQDHYLRSRLEVSYNTRHCPIDPFVSFETSNNLAGGFSSDKQRYSVGADWTLSKQHALSLAYIYKHGSDDDDNGNAHIISLGYKFKF